MSNQIDFLILGYDGYIGYPLTIDLINRGHSVVGVDNLSRRERSPITLTNIESPIDRNILLRDIALNYVNFFNIDIIDSANILREILKKHTPKTIIHLAQMPSAPWSMHDFRRAAVTQYENVIGTLHLLWAMREFSPTSHLIKLGTMGEYGTPNVVIPEGKIDRQCDSIDCPMYGMQFPRDPGSFYHASKVFDSINIKLACDLWGLKCTDIMQGIVYGVINNTRLDYDQYFGTVINRLCVQAAVEMPLTIYGEGNQTRGFLPLQDSIQCINLIAANPPQDGEYRVFNQFGDILSVNKVAEIITSLLPTPITHIPNPRVEDENNTGYDAYNSSLISLGYRPSDTRECIRYFLNTVLLYKDNIDKSIILPTTTWR